MSETPAYPEPTEVVRYTGATQDVALRRAMADAREMAAAGYQPAAQVWEGTTLVVTYLHAGQTGYRPFAQGGRGSSPKTIAGLLAGILVLLVAAGAGWYFFLRPSEPATPVALASTSPGPTIAATAESTPGPLPSATARATPVPKPTYTAGDTRTDQFIRRGFAELSSLVERIDQAPNLAAQVEVYRDLATLGGSAQLEALSLDPSRCTSEALAVWVDAAEMLEALAEDFLDYVENAGDFDDEAAFPAGQKARSAVDKLNASPC
jgi:hypothetical protein